MQLSGRRRMTGGFEMLFQYTYSKTNTDGLGYYGCGGVNAEGAYWQDAYNRRGNYGPACFDVRHNFTTAGIYNLPFGKGQKFGSGMSKAADLVLGGWNINYNLARRGGFPVTVFASQQNTNSGRSPRGNARANRYRPANFSGTRTVDSWFGKVFTASDFCANLVRRVWVPSGRRASSTWILRLARRSASRSATASSSGRRCSTC
jgi:hypothetical protein